MRTLDVLHDFTKDLFGIGVEGALAPTHGRKRPRGHAQAVHALRPQGSLTPGDFRQAPFDRFLHEKVKAPPAMFDSARPLP